MNVIILCEGESDRVIFASDLAFYIKATARFAMST